ncbi:hypothetical protein C5167_005078 [Papaver somniferum]|uniref:Uncharacterized protein n=1 Tax=Papaver somniferum TaxID=3469 RepID=A0A4Y7JCZ2_PAPSO|nr:hypothetical protein C5167_005078 [Papaver somniferum]
MTSVRSLTRFEGSINSGGEGCRLFKNLDLCMPMSSQRERENDLIALPLICCLANPEDVLIVEDENGNTVLSNLPKMVPLLLPQYASTGSVRYGVPPDAWLVFEIEVVAITE